MSREQSDESDLDVVIQTGITNPIGIGLAESLLQEAGIPFFAMDRNVAARQESGNLLGWWNVRVPRGREVEAREILRNMEKDSYPYGGAALTGYRSWLDRPAGATDAPTPEELAAWDGELVKRSTDFRKPEDPGFAQERGFLKSRNPWLKLLVALFFIGIMSVLGYSVFELLFRAVPK